MAALANDVNAHSEGQITTLPFSANAADTYYRGALVYIDTGGGVQVTFAAGDIALGYVPYQQTTTAAGDIVEVVVHGAMWLPVGTNVAAADEGDWLINDGPANTDNPADLEASGDLTLDSNDMICGRILRVTSSQMLIWIDPVFMGCVYFTNGTPANYSGWGLHLA